MKLKLDLHPIYSDTAKIETSLKNIIDEAVEKRATEVEIIPGKGSGALKKSVIRFLDRPEIKAKYHRIEKDSDNWGRLFVHFRPKTDEPVKRATVSRTTVPYRCFCCEAEDSTGIVLDDMDNAQTLVVQTECPSCGSPNAVTVVRRGPKAHTRSVSNYPEAD